MNFRRSIITAELRRPEVARRWKNRFFAFFGKTTPYGKIFKILFRKDSSRHRLTCMLCSNFVKFGRREIRQNSALLTCQKQNFAWFSRALATARITSKICQGQPQRSRFRPNRFTFGGVIPERVKTIKTGYKVFPIFGWSLASSRIIKRNIIVMLTIRWIAMWNSKKKLDIGNMHECVYWYINIMIFSERELTFTFVICYRPSVCRLSVCLSCALLRRFKFSAIFLRH